MVYVFNKDLLSWYLITLKFKEAMEAGIPKQRSEGQQQEGQMTEAATPATEANVDRDEESCSGPSNSEWIISIHERLEAARRDDDSCPWGKLSIYRAPKCLREGDDRSYAPQVASIGPYHRHSLRLRDMEHHKWRSLHRVLRRTGHDVRLYLDAVKELEDQARACYEGPISLSSNEFAECMALDGCFVLELFRGATSSEGFRSLGYSSNDPVFAMRGLMHSIQRDMIMLENQIPLFILERLLPLQLGLQCADASRRLVSTLAVRFFDPLMPTDEPLPKIHATRLETQNVSKSGPHTETIPLGFDPLADQVGGLHCLDVFRQSLLRPGGAQQPPRIWSRRRYSRLRVADKRRQQLIHCVSMLREAGVKFHRRKTDRFWDVRFEGGILKIPRLLIHDGTKSLFQNLIAFEQCHLETTNEITSYVIFMDNLINSAEDVRHLRYRGIIEHWLGSDEEVADLFNQLCQEVVFDVNDSCLSQLSGAVNRYSNHRWNAWRASLKHTYFNNPWAVISLFAAAVLLVLTLIQTFYGVSGYYKPH